GRLGHYPSRFGSTILGLGRTLDQVVGVRVPAPQLHEKLRFGGFSVSEADNGPDAHEAGRRGRPRRGTGRTSAASCGWSRLLGPEQSTKDSQPLGAVVLIRGVGFFDVPHRRIRTLRTSPSCFP